MKKKVCLLLVTLILISGGYYVWGVSTTLKQNQTTNDTYSETMLLQNLTTGEFILEKNKNKKVKIASLTKLVTAYLLLENELDLTKTVIIDQKITDGLIVEGASVSGFMGGDEINIRDLAYGIVLPSGADAAIAAANVISGSESSFVEVMNQLAQKLEMENTHFKNATGLDARNHYSTVEDLNKFMQTALQNEEFRKLVTTTTYQTAPTNLAPEGYYIESTMLKDSTDLNLVNGEILGRKTGYTKKAAQCLISLAKVNGEDYLLITTGADGTPSTEQLHVLDAKNIYETIH